MTATHLPYRTYLYFLAQSINLTTAVMSVTMAALVGGSLAPEPWLSTVPYGFQFLFVMLFTLPASRLMAAIGRKKSFLLASLPLAVSGVVGYWAIEMKQFSWLVASHALLGIYIAFANFNRFAATDGLNNRLKPRAISLVVAGGVLAAVSGPMLIRGLKTSSFGQEFAACYAAFTVLAGVSLLLNLLIKEVKPVQSTTLKKTSRGQTLGLVLHNKTLAIAICIAAIGYGIMNLLMIQASMHMSHLHVHFSDISTAIQWHVLAMFAPSFFTGILIQRFGLKTIAISGIVLLLLSSLINIVAHGYTALSLSLLILGLGWNFTYVGGSALLSNSLEDKPQALEVQGLNDLGVSICATLGAFAPAFLFSFAGWSGTNILSASICLLLLLLSLIYIPPQQSGKP
ncbi:MFS transporter [Alcaligenes sp. DN25]|uniref:MFS transporter n=1 Tax=Alcaligenes TaxID=507 RepID=UPI00202F9EA3|nr:MULTISPECIES: MFS transporter [Alcaligenes]URW81841.1 MFS transporter [Alcaligenes sp. DN25]WEA66658.1 MFS transporter [Alcaligenes faecalis]